MTGNGSAAEASALPGGERRASFAQLRFWYLHRLAPASPAHHLPFAARLEGPFDAAALTAALAEVVRRHELLRTVFLPGGEGEPVLEVLPAGGVALPVVDLSGLAAEIRGAEEGRLAREERARPFDLTAAPPLRLVLCRGGGSHILLGTLHPIAGDAESLLLLGDELAVLYEAARRRLPSPLADPPLQYADFAAWQRRWVESAEAGLLVESWRRQLVGLPPPLPLPAGRPRPALRLFEGAAERVRLEGEEAARLLALARRQGGGLAAVLAAGLAALLARYTGQADFCLGMSASGRSAETRGLIGCFVNVLPLRADLSGDPTFRQLVGRMRERIDAAHRHRDLPFEKLAEAVAAERGSRHPLLRAMLHRLEPARATPPASDALAGGSGRLAAALPLDLSVGAAEREGEIEIEVAYDADRFDREEGARFARHLRELLGGAAAGPDRPLSTLPPAGPLSGHPAPADPPRTPLEEVLCRLWAEVLEVPGVGRHDDFFALGGHSLLAARLQARIHQTWGVELELRALFEAPTVAGLGERLEEALAGPGGETASPLVRRPRDGALPLSFAQQRLWFLDRLEPGSAAYNLPLALALFGALDLPALAAAFGEIVRRHEVLRSRFPEVDGAPALALSEEVPRALPVVDLAALAESRRRDEAHHLAARFARRPFDLARGPLWRAAVLRLEGGGHILLASFHHAVSDGWSQGILRRELSALYAAAARRLPSPLREPGVQYADFAYWQRRRLSGARLERQLAFWRERLYGVPPLLPLPTDRPRPTGAAWRGGVRPLALPRAVDAALREAGRAVAGATPFMVVLAAFQAFLARLTGEELVCVGTPIAGRTAVEVEELVGLFVNTLVMRGDLDGDPTWRELLVRTRDAALQAYAHQELPFERLVEDLKPERQLGVSPLFQVMLAFQNVRREPLDLPGLRLEAMPAPTGTVKLDLSLTLAEGAGGTVEYAADLFDSTTVDRWIRSFTTLLACALAAPGLRLGELPLLSAEEGQQIRVEWGDTAASDARAGESLLTLLLAESRRSPDAVAVVGRGETLTYGELHRRAAAGAAHLAAAGVGPGSFVPVQLAMGPRLLVALTAVLHAGAAFVPLDPAWPEERVRGVLADLGGLARGVLLDETAVPPGLAGEEARGAATLPRRLPPEASIYALYTSGSTGRPKGVVVPHRGIVNRFLWMERFFGAGAARRVLQTTPPVYDSAVWQLFWPLTLGGTTFLTEAGQATDPAVVGDLVERHGITLVDFVPSVFDLLVGQASDPGAAARLRSLAAVVVGGEEMGSAAARSFCALFPEVVLANLYGPTEASIGCICHRVTAADFAGGERRVPIGRPIHGAQAVILDRWGSAAPVGVAGELGLAGLCLGQGYLRQGGQTGAVFVPHPFSETPGERLYRTGDLARLCPTGEIDFLGRIDRQVKIRGVRIELGEIEAVLWRHPGVSAAGVLVQAGALAAGFVPAPGSVPSSDDLRAYLGRRLPASLVPSRFVPLESLPRTAVGKVDRRALERAVAEEGGRTGGPAPRDGVEQKLAAIWRDLLGVEEVGIHDSFFEIGGHSLLAVRLMARIERELGHELPLSALFEAATVERLAARLQAGEAGPSARPLLVALQPRGGRRPFFCVHAVGGNVFRFLDLAARLGEDQPFYGLQAPSPSGTPADETLPRRAALYLEALRTVQPEGPYRLGGWSLGGVVAFEMARQLEAVGEEVELLALLEPSPPVPSPRRQAPREGGGREHASPAAEEEAFSEVAALHRQNARLLETYRPGGRVRAPLHCFLAEGNPRPGLADRWRAFTAREVASHPVPGDHDTFLAPPHVETLASRLALCLEGS